MPRPESQNTPTTYCPLIAVSPDHWQNLTVEHLKPQPGEGHCFSQDEHTIFLSLATRPVNLLHIQDGKTSTGLYGKGDVCVTPAGMSLFAKWDEPDHILQIRIKEDYIQRVAAELFPTKANRLEVLPNAGTRDAKIDAIATLILAELQAPETSSALYVDSLTNVIAVNLLQNYAGDRIQTKVYSGGLPHHQLRQVLDYIDHHLDQVIKLTELADLLNMSQFHFCRLFKQSVGLSPYQYLLQQRVERAKEALLNSDRLIADIALDRGFNSHSHLSKQFRQLTGLTPNKFRNQ